LATTNSDFTKHLFLFVCLFMTICQ